MRTRVRAASGVTFTFASIEENSVRPLGTSSAAP